MNKRKQTLRLRSFKLEKLERVAVSLELIRFWESKCRSNGQTIYRFLQNPKVHCRVKRVHHISLSKSRDPYKHTVTASCFTVPWIYSKQVLPKHRYPSVRLHGITLESQIWRVFWSVYGVFSTQMMCRSIPVIAIVTENMERNYVCHVDN